MLAKLFVKPELATAGLYTVRFYINGMWQIVIVDDYIPYTEIEYGSDVPRFTYSRNCDDIGAMILEKAYAKLHGCYESVQNIPLANVLRDLTGGKSLSYLV